MRRLRRSCEHLRLSLPGILAPLYAAGPRLFNIDSIVRRAKGRRWQSFLEQQTFRGSGDPAALPAVIAMGAVLVDMRDLQSYEEGVGRLVVRAEIAGAEEDQGGFPCSSPARCSSSFVI